MGDIASTSFRVETFERDQPVHTRMIIGYEKALRWVARELLGTGGDLARVYMGKTLVAEAYVQHPNVRGRGRKTSVRIVGEKAAKVRR